MGRVSIQPELIHWALDRCGKPEDVLRTRFPKITDWLRGEIFPTFKQLESFAAATHTPLGYFFLKEPPEDKLPIPDFRTIKGQPQRPTPDLLDTIQTMQSRQEWMREFLREEGQKPLTFVNSATLEANPAEVAMDMRNILSLSDGWANKVGTWAETLRLLRKAIEEAGVMIVINGRDSKSAQMFTIIHELSHLWLGFEGVSNFNQMQPIQMNEEKFCNKVAAEFLVPSDEFIKALKAHPTGDDDNTIQSLAKRFKVSPLVVARRALDIEHISKKRFFEFYNRHIEESQRIQEIRKARKESSGDFWKTQGVRIGELFGSAVVQATLEGRLLYRDAYKLTGLKGKTFDSYIAQLGF